MREVFFPLAFAALATTPRPTPATSAPGALASVSHAAPTAWSASSLSWIEAQEIGPATGLGQEFGSPVAISGTDVIVGDPFASLGSNANQGAAYAFAQSPAGWASQLITAIDGGASSAFGTSVAVSDGTLVVGSPGQYAEQGAAYVFVRDPAAGWVLQQQLVASDGFANDHFGGSVAVSGDTAVVGAPPQASLYVFRRSGGTWTQTQEIVPDDLMNNGQFGASLSISDQTLLVATPQASVGFNIFQGAAYAYIDSPAGFVLQQKLVASDAMTTAYFGNSIALSGDVAIVGEDNEPNGEGTAYVFRRSGTTWTQTQKIFASDGAVNDEFGLGVALSGTTAIIGAPRATVNAFAGQGAAYVFSDTGSTLLQTQKLSASDGTLHGSFGAAVALSGTIGVVGAPFGDVAYVETLVASNGSACTANGGCASSLCVGGVCCATSCGGCGDCSSGACVGRAPGATAGAECGPYVCSGQAVACPAGCASDADCIAGAYCSGGECHLAEANGAACTVATECANGNCVDGVCCDGPCAGQCEACDVVGHGGACSPVTGVPHGARAACVADTSVCGGACDGKAAAACTYPPSTTICSTSCADGQETDRSCDGAGSCPAGGASAHARSCENLTCADALTCKTVCAFDADCLPGFACDKTGKCGAKAACTADGHASQRADGAIDDCEPYACNVSGACNTACTTVADCFAPNVCDPRGACVAPPVPRGSSSGGCALAAWPSGSSPWAIAAGLGLAAVSAWRRRSRVETRG